jgi:hypothetical protein
MALTITDDEMTSDLTPATARFSPNAAADGTGAWTVSYLYGRLLTRKEAITAMTIAEEEAKPEPDHYLIASLASELPA